MRLLRRGYGGSSQAHGLALVVMECQQRRVEAVGHTAPTARALKASSKDKQPPGGAYAAVGFAYGVAEATTQAANNASGAARDAEAEDSPDTEDSEDDQAAAVAATLGIRSLGRHVREDKRQRAEEAERSNQPRPVTVKEVRMMRHARGVMCRS